MNADALFDCATPQPAGSVAGLAALGTRKDEQHMRRLKVFGLAFVAALALSGVVAAAAFATYDSEAETTTLKGSQVTENVFTTNSGTVKCKSATFEGTQSGSEVAAGIFTSEEITVHPTYKECRAFGLVATVDTTGCDYKFTKAISKQAPVHVECAEGKQIVVNAGFGECITEVGPQTPGGVVDFENQGASNERDVLVTSTVTGIEYTQAGTACTGGGGPFNNGTYTGSVTVKGFNAGGGQVGVWVT